MAGANRLAVLALRSPTHKRGGDVDTFLVQLNRLATQVSWGMPGVVTTDPGSTAGTVDAKTWKTAAFTFTFRGLNVSAVSQEKAFTGTTHDVAASKEAWLVMSVRTDGTTFTITKGADQTIGTVVLPTSIDNEVIVGYLQIVTGVTGWVANTDDLAADGAKIASYAFTDNPAISLIGNLAGTARTATN